MYAYCNNSPVVLVDYSGTLPSGVKPMQVVVNDGGSGYPCSGNNVSYTASTGGIFSIGIGPLSVSLQITLVTDSAGVSEIQISYSAPNILSSSLPSVDEMLADITSDSPKFKIGVSIAGTFTFTNAPSVSNLYGPTYSIGGALGGVAVDYNAIPIGDGSGRAYSGITIASGMITPGFNVSMSNTVYGISVPFSFFDIVEAMYNGVYGR